MSLEPFEIIDFNGAGLWSADQIQARYHSHCLELELEPRDLAPMCHTEGNRKWIYPVMDKVIDGIKLGDAACIRLGIAFIHEDIGFSFGRIIKANIARALRMQRGKLTDAQKCRIKNRVLQMLSRQYLPRELGEYVKLAAKLGMGDRRWELEAMDDGNPYVNRHVAKLLASIAP